ncbi:MAG: FAD:protein FMN transferase [Solirubrobacteraceae bacterium]|nr:FAD:protein FMN transferase [Solirubrobacteraceae bacterium]
MTATLSEISRAYPCFGSTCGTVIAGDGPLFTAEEATGVAREMLLRWHERFTRFDPTSELSRLNTSPHRVVQVSRELASMVRAAVEAAEATGGLVDATLIGAIEHAGYTGDLPEPMPLADALLLAPVRSAAQPARWHWWEEVVVDEIAGTVSRPPGLRFDGGGIVKGLVADLLAAVLARHDRFVVDCAGDLRLGGLERRTRAVQVASPFGDEIVHTFELADGGVATSGIGRRSWRDREGLPAHHLLDPFTGRSAFTGIVQVTAVAPTALEAEVRAKAALLSGPTGAGSWLPDGGVVVYDDGTADILAAAVEKR